MLSQRVTQARPTAELLQKGLMQLETKSRAQRYPSWAMSVVCGKSRAGIHRFMSWGGGGMGRWLAKAAFQDYSGKTEKEDQLD